jgi:hypothetical protein
LEKAIRSPNPERANRVLCDAADVIAGEGWRGLVIEDFEVDSVEPSYAAFGRNPDITVA